MPPTAQPVPVAPVKMESVVSVLLATAATAAISGLPVIIQAVSVKNAPVQVPPRSIKPPAKICGTNVPIVPHIPACPIIAEAAPLPAAISLVVLSAGRPAAFAMWLKLVAVLLFIVLWIIK
jgi:hypothetical protein